MPHQDSHAVSTEEVHHRLEEFEAQRAELERQRDFISAILDTTEALVIVVDRRGSIVEFNRACERTTGYRFEEVRGKALWDVLLVPEEVESVRAVFRELHAGNYPVFHEAFWRTKTSQRRLIAWSKTVLRGGDGAAEFFVGTGMDVTDQRRAEQERQNLIEELKTKNAELERFAYTISHDLTSPLITIRGYLGLLKEDLGTHDAQQVERDMAHIAGATERIHQLLHDVLELSRLGRPATRQEEVSIDELVRDARAILSPHFSPPL